MNKFKIIRHEDEGETPQFSVYNNEFTQFIERESQTPVYENGVYWDNHRKSRGYILAESYLHALINLSRNFRPSTINLGYSVFEM